MVWETVYSAIRSEINANQVLMHSTTVAVLILLLAGAWICETRQTILSVLLPLVGLSWAAAIVRFDYFIQRQGAYLRAFEQHAGVQIPLWETWKAGAHSTKFVVPVLDAVAAIPIFATTIYLLFGPAKEYFEQHLWRGATVYVWTITALFLALLASLAIVSSLAKR